MTTTFAELVVDSGIRTRRDLTALLPAELAKRIDDGAKGLLDEMQSAAALRILVTIKDPGWQRFVGPVRIDWDGMLNSWSRHVLRESSSVRIRVEAAASLAGWAGASPDLLYVCRALDRANLLAVVDAMRIVADGGLKPDPVGDEPSYAAGLKAMGELVEKYEPKVTHMAMFSQSGRDTGHAICGAQYGPIAGNDDNVSCEKCLAEQDEQYTGARGTKAVASR